MAENPVTIATMMVTLTMDVLVNNSHANGTEYPFDDEHGPPYWSLPMRIVYSLIMITFGMLALFGNLMVLIVIARHKSMRTRTNMFIANLAIADFLVSTLNMPFSLGTVIHGDWPFGDIMCQFNGFFMPLLFICSQHTLMYMALHKYFTVIYPFKRIVTFRVVIGMLLAAWICSGILSVLAVTGLNHIKYKPWTTQCGPSYPQDLHGYIHVILMTIFTYIIPVFIMVFSYIRMFIEIRAYSHRLEKNTNQDKDTIIMQQKRAVITMFIVMAAFLLCWTPYTVYAISSSVITEKHRIPHNVNAIVYLCGYVNSSMNPIIYGFRNRSFRAGYQQLLCRGTFLMPESDHPHSQGSHGTLHRMASTLSRQINTLRRGSSRNAHETDKSREWNGNERQALVWPSFKESAKKVLLSSGAVAYMKSGKIIKVDYPKEERVIRPSTVDQNSNDDGRTAEPPIGTFSKSLEIANRDDHEASCSPDSNRSIYDNLPDIRAPKFSDSEIDDDVFLPPSEKKTADITSNSHFACEPGRSVRDSEGADSVGFLPNSPFIQSNLAAKTPPKIVQDKITPLPHTPVRISHSNPVQAKTDQAPSVKVSTQISDPGPSKSNIGCSALSSPEGRERRPSNQDLRTEVWNMEVNDLKRYSPETGKKIFRRLPSMDTFGLERKPRRKPLPRHSPRSQGLLYDLVLNDKNETENVK